jgi:demethylmenaquinone methyltransferase/2-methoxy-6-polyprenyl-1,4-benzoquinol methylase
VFDAVSPRYDLMNDLMSAGLHRLWKRFAVDLTEAASPASVRSTSRVAPATSRAGMVKVFPARGRVLVSDINAQMLWRGRDRALDAAWSTASNTCRPMPSACRSRARAFDCVTIGFGLRNVTTRPPRSPRCARVLRPGGSCWCWSSRPSSSPA